MDEEYFYGGVSTDVMSQRCEMINELAQTADTIDTPEIKRLLIQSIEAMVWSITPPKGELVAVKVDFPTKKSTH